MGFFSDSIAEDDPGFDSEGSFDPDILGLGGREGAIAATKGAEIQAQSGREAIEFERQSREQAQGFFAPFAGAAEQGLEQSSFLTDSQEQFDFLKSNPLFKLALDNANTQTQNSAAAGGRLSAGDTLQNLSNNVLLSASPLIDRQSRGISQLLNLGLDVTKSQANTAIGAGSNISNLLTDIGAAQAAGGVGAANAQLQGNQNIASLGGAAFAAFSDPRLKDSVSKIGKANGYNVYEWEWNDKARQFGLEGRERGVMADEVKLINPAAVTERHGYMMVNYRMIGVR